MYLLNSLWRIVLIYLNGNVNRYPKSVENILNRLKENYLSKYKEKSIEFIENQSKIINNKKIKIILKIKF